MRTHTYTHTQTNSTPPSPPPHGFFSSLCPFDACCWAEGPPKVLLLSFFFPLFLCFFFCLPSSHCSTLHSPAPWPPSGFGGCEMHNQCNIHERKYVMFFFFQIYCTECIFFSLCVLFFSPFAF